MIDKDILKEVNLVWIHLVPILAISSPFGMLYNENYDLRNIYTGFHKKLGV